MGMFDNKMSFPLTTTGTMIVEEFEVPVTKQVVAALAEFHRENDMIVRRHGSKWGKGSYEVKQLKMVAHSRTPLAKNTRLQLPVTLSKAFWQEDTAKVAYTLCFFTLQHKVTKERIIVDVVNTKNCSFKSERGLLELE